MIIDENSINFEDIEKAFLEDQKTVEVKEKAEAEKKIPKELLKFYYEQIFPCKYFFKWLSNENTDVFERREFTFTLEGDIYCRFLCFKNDEELRNEMKRAVPIKIDLGAIYNTLPKLHNSVIDKAFTPVKKEMVFDIDMSDYDDVRSCCKDTKLCDKCWSFMKIAYKIISRVLQEDFGFTHNLWIYSGRRGIHCWVCDDRAKNLSNDGRAAIANYIKITGTNVKTGGGFFLKPSFIHPSHLRAIEIIKNDFFNILNEQEMFKSKTIRDIVIMNVKAHFTQVKTIKNVEIRVRELMNKDYDMFDEGIHSTVWKEIEDYLTNLERDEKIKDKKNLIKAKTCMDNIMIIICYPRLDINVSKHLNHLLKSPFSVHPKTGYISVPLSEDDIMNFALSKIPDIETTIEDKTCFNHYYNQFKAFVDNLNKK